MGQWVKNLAAMKEARETGVRFLGWEDSLEEEVATHCLRNPMDRVVPGYSPKGHKELDTTE